MDGKKYNKLNRGIDIKVILDNIEFLIKELNNIKLQRVKIHFNLHNVISRNVFNDLKTQEEIDEYWDELNGYAEYFNSIIKNKNVTFTKICPPGIEFPVLEACKEEGENFYNFLNRSMQGSGHENFFAAFYNLKGRMIHFYEKNNLSVNDILLVLKNLDYTKNTDKHLYENLSHGTGCGV